MAVAWMRHHALVESLVVYDLATKAPLRTYRGPLDWNSHKVPMDFDPRGTRIAFIGPGHAVQVLDVDGDAAPVTLGHHAEQVCSLRFNPDGSELATSADTGDLSVRIWDLAAGRERLRVPGHTARVWGLAYSPDGDLLATGSDDGTFRLSDTRTGQTLMTVPLSGGVGLSIAFSPDGRHIAVGCNDAVRLFALEGRRERRRLPGSAHGDDAMAFLPRGDQLVTRSDYDMVSIWDTRSGHRLVRWKPLSLHFVSALAISPDGTMLATGTHAFLHREDGRHPVLLWRTGQGVGRGGLEGHAGGPGPGLRSRRPPPGVGRRVRRGHPVGPHRSHRSATRDVRRTHEAPRVPRR